MRERRRNVMGAGEQRQAEERPLGSGTGEAIRRSGLAAGYRYCSDQVRQRPERTGNHRRYVAEPSNSVG